MRKRSFLGLAALSPLAWPAAAADYPAQPVKLVVAWSPGGATDISARMLAERLQTRWKQSVIVENRPGAAGAIGTEQVVRSAPDGYTVLINVSTLLVNEVTSPRTAFRLFRDLVPVTTLWMAPVTLVAATSVAGRNLKDVLAEAAKPGARFSYGHHGDGTATHLAGERLNRLAGASMVAVPYAGDGPVSQALIGGHIQLAFMTAPTAEKLVAAGKGNAVAQLFHQRSPLLPQVPTFGELGYADMDRGSWGRLFVPTGTPDAVVAKLAADVSDVLTMPDVKKQYEALGLLSGGGTPARTLQTLQSDYAYWMARVRETGAAASK